MVRCPKCNHEMSLLEDTLLKIPIAYVCPICQHIQWETPHWLQKKTDEVQREVWETTRQPFPVSWDNEYRKDLDELPEKEYRRLMLGDWTPPETEGD